MLFLLNMKILKWLTFFVLFSVSLCYSYKPIFEDSTLESTFTYESTFDDSISERTDDYQTTFEDSTSKSTYDYQSTFDDSSAEVSFNYQNTFEDSTPRNIFKSFAIKNLLYPPHDRNCPLHEHWEQCTGQCQRNCSNWRKALICPDICIQGCLCDWGFTRGHEGNCIPVSECPPIENEVPIKINVQYKCKKNEHFSFCDANDECQKNCSNYDKDIPCSSTCVHGCICDEGFVRSRSGKCIATEHCNNPSIKSTLQLKKDSFQRYCKRNEHFSTCDGLPICQKSCSNYNESIICPRICYPGCVCDKGYVIGPNGECIPLEQCDFEMMPFSTEVSSEKCSVNEYDADACGPNCIRYCFDSHKLLRLCGFEDCVTDCFCLPGYVKGPDGNCLPPDYCPLSSEGGKQVSKPPKLWASLFANANKERFSTISSETSSVASIEPASTVSYETSSTTSSGGLHLFTTSPTEEKCPNESLCSNQCRLTGHKYGVCIGVKEEHCVCF